MIKHSVLLLKIFVLAVIAGVLVMPELARAQGGGSDPMEEALRGARKLTVKGTGENSQELLGRYSPHALGAQSVVSSGDQENTFVQSNNVDNGQNDAQVPVPIIKPMQGLTQLADSEDMQKMLKALIAMKVPVMYETMMMVENGAATGFIGSMQTIHGLMDTTLQASNLQLKMYDTFDHQGLGTLAYNKAIYEQLKKPQQKDALPLALWAAVEDVVKPGDVDTENQYQGQKTVLGGPGLNSSASGPAAGASTSTGGTPPPPNDTKKLSDVLFKHAAESGAAASNGFRNEKVDAFKQEFIKLLGDIEFQIKEGDTGAPLRSWKYIAPQKIEDRSAFEGTERKYTKEAWKGLQTILQKYCEYKKSGGGNNYQTEIFQKKRPASVFEDNQEKRLDASAPDMPLTVNFVDKIFKLVVTGKDIADTNFNCSQQFPTDEAKMPDAQASSPSSGTSFDDCANKPEECLRTRVVHNAAKLVARSNVLHRYKFVFNMATRFTTNKEVYGALVGQLFANIFPRPDIDEEIEFNRRLWLEYHDFIGRLAQGQVSSNIFRPGAANQSSSASPDKAQ